jgi:UDP-N-acetylglucosamine acyltransferase
MAYVHFAHDCQIGNHTIFANNATLAGHVKIADYAILGGFSMVHQFCQIGMHAITGMGAVLSQDVPPYITAAGNPTAPHGINSVGLKRRGFSNAAIMAIKRAYKTLYKSGLMLEQAKVAIEEQAVEYPDLNALVDFLGRSQRGVIR